jgi:hypothetical protein
MSASPQTALLPNLLRNLRVGMDDTVLIRRTVQLAAAKIEDLEDQVARLAAELQAAMSAQQGGGRVLHS